MDAVLPQLENTIPGSLPLVKPMLSKIPDLHGATRLRRAKLVPPSLGLRSVQRSEIVDLVLRPAATSARLVLFRAPAGFGKTTAMRQYLAQLQASKAEVAVAWLTLDALDDDYRRFLLHLIGALVGILRLPQTLPSGLQGDGGEAAIDRIAFELIDQVADCEHPFALFIDEFEAVSNRAIDELLRLLLARLPDHGQLVMASRETPNLQLGRLRALGQLVEIDQLRLRFSRAEADDFLRTQCGLNLSENDVTKLHGDTEGWPAALWLAATALEDRSSPQSFIATFSGSNAAVAEYLAEDVLLRQPESVQRFLLQTSVLSELSVSLCNAVCERDDAAQMLERLARSNVCLTTLDAERRQYRYHGLFADFLRNQLRRLYPDELPALHRRAAQWYLQENRPIPAIEHAVASTDMEYALSLLLAHSDRLLFQGRFRLLARWLDSMPEWVRHRHPSLGITHAWALTFTGRSPEALCLIDRMESDPTLGAAPQRFEADTEVLRPFILGILDRHEEGVWLAEESLVKHAVKKGFAYNVLATTVATFQVAANRYYEAIELLKGASRAGSDPESQEAFPVVYAMCVEGLVDLVQGRVRQAVAHFRVALSSAPASFGSRSTAKSIAAVFLAEALYEMDELDEAEQLLALYLPIVREYALPDHVVISHVIQARIAMDRGDDDHAWRRLSELEFFGRQAGLPRVFAAAQLERARMAVVRHAVPEAHTHAERASAPEAWNGLRGLILPANDVETLAVCRIRVALMGSVREELVGEIKALQADAYAMHRNRRALKLGILLAKAQHASGQRRLAMRSIESALQAAAAQGLVRTFLDEGPAIIELVREFRLARAEAVDPPTGNALLAFVDRLLQRAGVSVEAEQPEAPSVDTEATLSAREVQILDQLTLGLSNLAIADKLFVTETTIRAHLRKINVKLGTSNRTQAVSVARRLGLIR